MSYTGQVTQPTFAFPSPGDLPDPGIEPVTPALGDGFTHANWEAP